MAKIKLCLEPKISKTLQSCIFPVFSNVFKQVSDIKLREQNMDYLYNCTSEISNVCNAVDGHCLQVQKIVDHHANDRFDWLRFRHQSISPSKEAYSA